MKPLFDTFRNSFANPWPIHVTTDTSDLTQVDEYNSAYVWLKHQNAPINENFDFTWKPAPENRDTIFDFPVCDAGLRPYNWTSLRLVPTGYRKDASVRMNIVAGTYTNPYSVLVFGTTRDNLKLHTHKFCNAMYVTTPITTDRVASRIELLSHSSHTLVMQEHVDSSMIDLSDLTLAPGVMYLFKSKNMLTSKRHVSSNVLLVPEGEVTDVEVLKTEIPIHTMTSTPDVMWKRGFTDAQVMLSLKSATKAIEKVVSNKGSTRFYLSGFKAGVQNPQGLDIKSPWYGEEELDKFYEQFK